MRTTLVLTAIVIGSMALTGCAANNGQAKAKVKVQTVRQNQDPYRGHTANLSDASVIPSVNRMKIRTTNVHGHTTSGMGTTVYSMIGSSGLNSGGFSSHLESRLSDAGIDGVTVFVIDDMVVLATEKRETTAMQYDPMQEKVLSGTAGFSGHGKQPGSKPGTYGTGNTMDDNLDQAEGRMKSFMGGEVRVLKVTSAEAVKTIKQIRAQADHGGTPKQVAEGVQKLLELAGKKK
ncbi:hypothetical protein [Paenibacillus spongiae]|uniref:Sporulation protein n=1 Tax=Paenibacillus spongiae TaxID=2909671 RepID=A0ABY5SA52_9BACL|nr:hypothetical protein [Paenibacillus spongiae]UVI30812.1 hypothetical protein L1F29_02735 [Paenibacillus spongiae]